MLTYRGLAQPPYCRAGVGSNAEPPTIRGSWGEGWRWQPIEGLDPDRVEVEMRAQGVLEVFRYDQRVDVALGD